MAELPKVDLESKDLVAERIEQMKALFPDVFTDRGIDFETLRLTLGGEVDDGDERYAFTWPGKKDSIRQSQETTSATLLPVPNESLNWDDTENVYIEGDNLEVLKLMQRAYFGKIRFIYIDPPYNTGSDFVYRDSFADSIENYREQSGLGGQSNADTSGRFHSDWCSMMYPRLRLARELLAPNGVIFISIDNNEVRNARMLCDEIFGEGSFVAQFTWEKKKKGSFLSSSVTNIIEYILCYAKNKEQFPGLIGEINSDTATYPCINAVNGRELRTIPAGIDSKYREPDYFLAKGSIISNTTMNLVLHSDLVIKNRKLASELVIEGNWRYSQEAMTQYALDGEIYLTQDLYLRRIVNDERRKTMKDLLPRVGQDSNATVGSINPANLFESGWGSNEDADEELRLLLGTQKILDYPKPVVLIAKLICAARLDEGDIVLDFFSGSATTAHALMKLNAIEGVRRPFILVQLPEVCADDSVAKRSGYDTICEIGKDRIKRAGQQIEHEIEEANRQLQLGQEPAIKPDTGFRVFKLDHSGIQNPEDGQLLIDRIKPDRNNLDIIFEMMLKWGLELTYPVEEDEIEGYPVYSIAYDELICCMQPGLTSDVLEAIAARNPRRVFLLDSVIDDTIKLNALQIFKRVEERTQQKIDLRTV